MHSKTKIICTIGPASESPEKLRALMKAGMNVARLNFSHGSHAEHAARIQAIREAAAELKYPIGIMLDTKGPEIRTGLLENKKITLTSGDRFTLTTQETSGTRERVQVSYAHLPQEVQKGDMILLSDGLISLEVESTTETDIICRVLNGGELGERKGVNIPGVRIELPFLSEQDKADIRFGIAQQVDFIAASFVRSAQDVLDLRRLLESENADIDIIAKIESQSAVDNLEEIIPLTDGVMVARGDLGVEIAPEEVPLVQKRILSGCAKAGKTVIVATQMLDSMIVNPRPTRAEISDVANAVFEGADTIMLSGETAAGSYPVEAVEMMERIALKTESSIHYNDRFRRTWTPDGMSLTDAISYATCATAMNMNCHTILSTTRSGNTARMVAKYRPQASIIAATPSEAVCRKMALVWGVTPLHCSFPHNLDEWVTNTLQAVLEKGLVQSGELVVITGGELNAVQGGTNLLMVKVAGKVLLEGSGIGKTPVSGRVCIVESAEDAEKLTASCIAVCRSADTALGEKLSLLAGIIAEAGGLTSNAAIMGIAAGIPVIVGAKNAVDICTDGMEVSLDPELGRVYAGKVCIS